MRITDIEDKEKKQEEVKKQEDIIPPAKYDKSEEWVKEYIKQFGEEPSFF